MSFWDFATQHPYLALVHVVLGCFTVLLGTAMVCHLLQEKLRQQKQTTETLGLLVKLIKQSRDVPNPEAH